MPERTDTMLNWVLGPRLLGIFLLVLPVYALLAEGLEFDLLGMKAPGESAFKHRLGECAVVWVVLCLGACWVQFFRGKRPAWTARIWPLLVVPAIAAGWSTVSAAKSTLGRLPPAHALRGDPAAWVELICGAILILAPLVVFALCALFFRLQARVWRRPSTTTCMGCGYDLHGNASGVCPECGTEVVKDATIPFEFHRRRYRWTPELAEFPDAKARAEAWRRAVKEVAASRISRAFPIIILIVVAAVTPATSHHFGRWRWFAVVGGSLAALGLIAMDHRAARRSLLRQLEERRRG